jgi:hypothetical protein
MALLEFVLGIARVSVFFNPKSIITFNYLNVQLVNQSSVESIFLSSKQSIAAFIIDWIASIVPTFMGFYVALFMLLGICGILSCLGLLDDKNQGNRANCVEGCGYCCNICSICANKANHRCVSLTWNCPCYKTRPKLRFQLRFGIQLFIIFLRTIAIILYVTDKKTDIYGKYMGSICAISIGIVCLVMILDYYQYRVWWHYKPSEAHEKCRCCCCTQTFHPSHQRFIPRPLLGRYRDPGDIGNEPCENTVAGYCSNLSLEHIVIYHAFDYIPQRRLQPDKDNTYIGFHCTDSSSAANIAKTGFLINPIAPQMLGYGIYFARCFAQAKRKARHNGMLIKTIFIFIYDIYYFRCFYMCEDIFRTSIVHGTC